MTSILLVVIGAMLVYLAVTDTLEPFVNKLRGKK